ncbi:MAG: hypothetical protein WC759_01095 [Candidatus Micrarchaeia archaeon]|jgi:hypothetical protein
MSEEWEGNAAGDDDPLGFGTCPICKGPVQTPDGFMCDSCSQKVCNKCIHSYRDRYICSDCVSLLSASDRRLVKNAKHLTKPLQGYARRSNLWWLFLALISLPVLLGIGYFFFTLGRLDYTLGATALLIALIWYWDKQVQNWS